MTTSEVLNSLVSDKLLGKYNLLRVLIPSTTLGGKSPANLIPAVKSWLGADQVELNITMDDIQIDMATNIYQHYSQRVMNTRGEPHGEPHGEQHDNPFSNPNIPTQFGNRVNVLTRPDSKEFGNRVNVLTRPAGKLALFNVTRDDTNMPRYAAHTLRKYESIITGISIDDRSNVILPIRYTPILHINMPEKGRILNEKYLEYRFRLLEFGKTPAHIFIKQLQTPNPGTCHDSRNNLVIGLEFTVDEKEFVSDARLAMIIKYISGLQILLGSM